jgi:E3 ubiquitin-protein ligase RNF144
LFCKACKVPFHNGYTCTEYKALSYGGDAAHDQAVSQLAAKNKWRPCPQCSAVVERTDGCKHMRCPCGVQFCYACGAKWARSNCSKNCRG